MMNKSSSSAKFEVHDFATSRLACTDFQIQGRTNLKTTWLKFQISPVVVRLMEVGKIGLHNSSQDKEPCCSNSFPHACNQQPPIFFGRRRRPNGVSRGHRRPNHHSNRNEPRASERSLSTLYGLCAARARSSRSIPVLQSGETIGGGGKRVKRRVLTLKKCKQSVIRVGFGPFGF